MNEIEITEARAALGLPPEPFMRTAEPVVAVGFRFPKLSVAFLREKAKQQLRDALGRWRRMRGSLDDDDGTPLERGNLQRTTAKKTAAKRTAAKKTAAKKTAAKKAAPRKRAMTGEDIGTYKDITTIERAVSAAQAEAKKARARHSKATQSLEKITSTIRKAATNPSAEQNIKDAAQTAAREAMQQHAAVARAVEAAEAAAEAAASASNFQAAMRAAREASAQLQRADEAAASVHEAAKTVSFAANANPRPPFVDARARRGYDNPDPGYRKATPEEEREIIGNSPMWSGIHIDTNPDSTKPYIYFKPDGYKKHLYSPAYHLAAERAKWERVEHFRPVQPLLKQKLEAMARGEGVTGTPLQQQRLRDNAFSTLLTLATGMRPSGPAAYSTIKGEKVKTYGSSNLERRHVERINRRPDGSITSVYLKFPGKSGKENRIKVTDPFLMEEIARRHAAIQGPEIRREKNPDTGRMRTVTIPERERQLSPISNSSYMTKMIREQSAEALNSLGMGDELADDFGNLADDESSAGDPMAEALGKFSARTLRTLHGNVVAAQIFSGMVGRFGQPTTPERFKMFMEEATKQASEILGNEHATFKKNYLSAIPFLQWMPQGELPDGSPKWEEWWLWGKKTLTRPE